MRWTPEKKNPNHRSGFLLLPKTIDGETRWWEHAKWEVETRCSFSGKAYDACIRWIDEERKDV